MASTQLENEVYEYALEYKNRRDFVSMVCGRSIYLPENVTSPDY